MTERDFRLFSCLPPVCTPRFKVVSLKHTSHISNPVARLRINLALTNKNQPLVANKGQGL